MAAHARGGVTRLVLGQVAQGSRYPYTRLSGRPSPAGASPVRTVGTGRWHGPAWGRQPRLLACRDHRVVEDPEVVGHRPAGDLPVPLPATGRVVGLLEGGVEAAPRECAVPPRVVSPLDRPGRVVVAQLAPVLRDQVGDPLVVVPDRRGAGLAYCPTCRSGGSARRRWRICRCPIVPRRIDGPRSGRPAGSPTGFCWSVSGISLCR